MSETVSEGIADLWTIDRNLGDSVVRLLVLDVLEAELVD